MRLIRSQKPKTPDSVWATDGGVYFGFECEEALHPDRPLEGEWKPTPDMHRYADDRHLVSVGPSGSGKTRRLLVPNLYLLKNWSIVVVDPKGSLAARTGPYRAALKNADGTPHKVIVIDPFRVLERDHPELVERHPFLKSVGFNPLAALDPDDDDFVDDAKALADAMIQIDAKGERHWAQSAQSLVKGLLMVARIAFEQSSLSHVRTWLGWEPERLALRIRGQAKGENQFKGWASEFGEDHPAIATSLNRFGEISPENKELLSILSTALTQTDWLDSEPVRTDLARGFFDFGSLKDNPATVYLILPPNRLSTHATWLRIMITAVLTPLLRSVRRAKVPVLMMLDEFAQLGPLPVIEKNLGIMREYGIKLWPVFQDLAQAKDIYQTRWESFVGNAGVLQSFAPHDATTRDYLSKLSGQRLYWQKVTSTGESSSPTQLGTSMSKNIGWQNQQGPVLWPQALGLMETGQSVLFSRGRVVRSLFPDPTELSGVSDMLAQLAEAST